MNQKFDQKFWGIIAAEDALVYDYKEFHMPLGSHDKPIAVGLSSVLLPLSGKGAKPIYDVLPSFTPHRIYEKRGCCGGNEAVPQQQITAGTLEFSGANCEAALKAAVTNAYCSPLR